MAISSSQLGLAGCFIYALITGTTFLLEGCGDGDGNGKGDPTPGDKAKCNFNMAEWKKTHEKCFHDITSKDGIGNTCEGIEVQLAKCFQGAPRHAHWLHHRKLEKDPCAHEKLDWKWAEAIIDSKFKGAKKTFQELANPCLRREENQPAQDCSQAAAQRRWAQYDVCWKPAEEDTPGGKWTSTGATGNATDITTECPDHWFFESIHTTRQPWIDWYHCKCPKYGRQPNCTEYCKVEPVKCKGRL